uniref:Uncharacterized protein n=2 Tax=Ralstonia solanacearum TaxID=305 RepID=A0A809E7Y6_RALSL
MPRGFRLNAFRCWTRHAWMLRQEPTRQAGYMRADRFTITNRGLQKASGPYVHEKEITPCRASIPGLNWSARRVRIGLAMRSGWKGVPVGFHFDARVFERPVRAYRSLSMQASDLDQAVELGRRLEAVSCIRMNLACPSASSNKQSTAGWHCAGACSRSAMQFRIYSLRYPE